MPGPWWSRGNTGDRGDVHERFGCWRARAQPRWQRHRNSRVCDLPVVDRMAVHGRIRAARVLALGARDARLAVLLGGAARRWSVSAPAAYHKLGLTAKRTHALHIAREDAIRCPACGIGCTPADLLAHTALRCPGRPDPHPHAKWIDWREAQKMGIPRTTLARLVERDIVRARGPERARRYLLRDVALWLAWQAQIDRRAQRVLKRTRDDMRRLRGPRQGAPRAVGKREAARVRDASRHIT